MFLVVEREPLQARARGNEISPRPNMSSAAKEAIEDRPDDQRRSYRMLLPLLSIPCCRHSRLSTRFLTRLPARFPARFSLVFCSPLNSPLPPHFHNAARCGLSSTPILHTSHTHPPKLHHFRALPPLAPGHSLLSWPANDTRIAPGGTVPRGPLLRPGSVQTRDSRGFPAFSTPKFGELCSLIPLRARKIPDVVVCA